MARRRPSTVLPVLPRGTGGAKPRKRRTGLPKGVSYTLSKKYQARIKLNGKRYDLGTFETKEDAAAAYAAAKTSGVAGGQAPTRATPSAAQARPARPTPASRTRCN